MAGGRCPPRATALAFLEIKFATSGPRPPTDQVEVHRRPDDPGRLRWRDGDAAAVYDADRSWGRGGRRLGLPAAGARVRGRADLRGAQAALAGRGRRGRV